MRLCSEDLIYRDPLLQQTPPLVFLQVSKGSYNSLEMQFNDL